MLPALPEGGGAEAGRGRSLNVERLTAVMDPFGKVRRQVRGARFTRADRDRCFRRCPRAVVPNLDAAVA